MDRKLFSESWHRVAAQSIRLRPSVRVRKQFFRGKQWYVANDLYGDQFFRFRPEAWDFIARLDGTQTVDEVWEQCLETKGGAAPGQTEAIQILSSLYQSNLIVSDFPADVTQLFERQKKRHAREWKARLFGIFFLRIPLFDPDAFLTKTMSYLRPLFSIPGAVCWLLLVGSALGVVVSNWEKLSNGRQGVLDPSNLPVLFVAFVIAKLVHELGHGYAVKRFGGEVHVMGITFLVFTPIPYVDATAAWAFRERWKRVFVGASGMWVELILAAIATFVWASTGPGLLNSWCYNLMVVASVSTVLFNINPLLKFDGYYILSDLTDSPNLQPRGMRQLGHWVETYAFGGKHSLSPASSRLDSVWLASFGVTSWLFRVYITYVIIMFVADRYLGLGFLAAVLTILGLIFVPIFKGVKFLSTESRIERQRKRAFGVTMATLVVLFVFLAVIPAPRYFRAPGVIFAEKASFLTVNGSGVIQNQDLIGEQVEDGQILLDLGNPEMPIRRKRLEAESDELAYLERVQLARAGIGASVLRQRRAALDLRIAKFQEEESAMEVRSPIDGAYASIQPAENFQRWLSKGETIGEIIPEGDWLFYAIVSQKHSNLLFDQELHEASIRFPGSAAEEVRPTEWLMVPGQQEYLPSPALGWRAFGPVQVREDDPDGVRAVEPFFLVVSKVPDVSDVLHHGRVGMARFRVDNEPYAFQWYRALRQALQERFRL